MQKRKVISLFSNNKQLIGNFSYITLLEVFLLLAPLITYPYLVRVLGIDNYGLIITAQVLASYASKIIDFGSNRVCAKHVSINRASKAKLSEIVSSVLVVRTVLWLICFAIYMAVVLVVPNYKSYIVLFLCSYFLTLNEVLFPQYFFQGMERMKYISIINIIVKLLFILLVFVLVKNESDMSIVPLMYAIGYALAGIFSMHIITSRMGLKLYIPSIEEMRIYVKDSLPIFATDMICTIKDKLSYFIIGAYCGMGEVVIYDLGLKINGLLIKPTQIVSTVLFPRFAKNRNTKQLKTITFWVFVFAVAMVALTNVFLPFIVKFFIDESIDLIPLRIFSLAPIVLSVSSFLSSNFFVAFGYNKYLLYSIIVTTIVYIVTLVIMLITHNLGTIYSFVILALISYLAELVYRLLMTSKILKQDYSHQI